MGNMYSKSHDDIRRMFGMIAHRYDFANSVLSGGMHFLWRRRLMSRVKSEVVGRALDVCTGTGDLLPPLAKYASSGVWGVDFCRPMLAQAFAQERIPEDGGVIQGDALVLPFSPDSFDLLTVSFGVRNFESLEDGLKELFRVVRPGGRLCILEFGSPEGRAWRALYQFYSWAIIPAIGGFLTGHSSPYRYLPSTALSFPCRDAFTTLLEKIGFQAVRYTSLTGGIAYLYEARKG